MDPKSLSHLDPKMRETYDRIMGTAAPSAPASSTTPPPAAAPIKADAPAEQHDAASSAGPSIFSPTPSNISAADASVINTGTTPPPAPDTTQPVSPTPYHVAETVDTQPSTSSQPAMQPLPSPSTVAQMNKTANAGPLLRILYILGAVIFFVIYTIFWIKIFKLPFFF